MGKITSFRDLDVWKKGIEIVDLVYNLTKKFPLNEKYGLSQHLQKTAISIPSNIAEGFVRQHTKEYVQFCHIALGSCAELETQAIIAFRQNYLKQSDLDSLNSLLDHESKMIVNLIKSLRLRIKPQITNHESLVTNHKEFK